MRKAIVIGATSGIGRALAVELKREGYTLGIAGRNEQALAELAGELGPGTVQRRIDVADTEAAVPAFQGMLDEMGGVDLIVISSGVGLEHGGLEWESQQRTLEVNVMGFAAMANVAFQYFLARGSGHLAGISSVAGVRGNRFAPIYGASKAFVSNLLEAYYMRAKRSGLPIFVTDLMPGFIDTPMTKRNQKMFWLVSAEVSARAIAAALQKRKKVAYIPGRWWVIAWFLRVLPGWGLERV